MSLCVLYCSVTSGYIICLGIVSLVQCRLKSDNKIHEIRCLCYIVPCHCITVQLVGELVKRTTQAESCHSSLEGDNDVKVDRATYLKAPPNDHDLIGQVSRRASSGSVDGMSSQDRRGKDRLQRLPHYKQRTCVRLPY